MKIQSDRPIARGRRAIAIGIAALAVTASSLVVSAPAQAADWKQVTTRTYCYVISGWSDCYRETTWKRTAAVCAKPAGSFTGGLAVWYSYCYKTTKVRL
jgi:uncharacterized membrane protein